MRTWINTRNRNTESTDNIFVGWVLQPEVTILALVSVRVASPASYLSPLKFLFFS